MLGVNHLCGFGAGGGASGSGGDPYAANVVSLLNMDGADDGTSFPDQVAGRSWTRNGFPVTKTGTKKYGTASGYFNGLNYGLIHTDDGAHWDIGTGDFTVEAWINLASITGGQVVFQLGHYSGVNGIVFYVINGKLATYCNATAREEATASVSANTWTHVAWSRQSGTMKYWTDGSERYSTAFTTNLETVGALTRISIGYDAQFGGSNLVGYIDDFRFTNGVARYTGAFTPPAEALTL